jgi:hypothetical protein
MRVSSLRRLLEHSSANKGKTESQIGKQMESHALHVPVRSSDGSALSDAQVLAIVLLYGWYIVI